MFRYQREQSRLSSLSMRPVVLNYSEHKNSAGKLVHRAKPHLFPTGSESIALAPEMIPCMWLEDCALRNIALGSYCLMFFVEQDEMMNVGKQLRQDALGRRPFITLT